MVCNGGVAAEKAWSTLVVFGTFPRFVFPAIVDHMANPGHRSGNCSVTGQFQTNIHTSYTVTRLHLHETFAPTPWHDVLR